MQFVPIIAQASNFLEEWLEVKKPEAVKAAKPVQQRNLPPLLKLAREHAQQGGQEQGERRFSSQARNRTYCRRIKHLPVVTELRSTIERRKRAQRSTDLPERIDVEA